MRTVTARTGAVLPVVGLGTWTMGEDGRKRKEEADALRLGFDLGMTLVDTAEMYASGGAEEVVGDALRGRRDGIFVVSKVLPENASREGTVRAAERSLARMKIDCIDLYLLHWKGRHPVEETLEAFLRLREDGKIRHYGVSNFDAADMERTEALPGGSGVAVNQVQYNLERRGIDAGALPWCRDREVAVMAYSPLGKGELGIRPALREVAGRHGITPRQAAIAWTIRGAGVITIPKSSNPDHVRANAAVAEVRLSEEDCRELDRAYPPPDGPRPLEVR